MFKRATSSTLLMLLIFTSRAQLSISVQEPPAGIIQKDQLWNIALIYSGNNTISVTIGLTLTDMTDNQPVIAAVSRPITLTKGIRQLKALDVLPVNYSYVSSAFNRLTDAFIPVGNYRACYAIYNSDQVEKAIMAEDCISLDVQPLSPPQLTLPADSAAIQDVYPLFTWLPPAPVMLFNDLNYDLLLAEVREDQSPGAAIQENIPVYNARRLTMAAMNYSSSAKSLDTGKVYAWRVIAKNGEAFVAQSEVWTFRVAKEKPETVVPAGGQYMELKAAGAYTSTGLLPDDILGIKYYSYDKAHETVVRFYNESGEVMKEIKKTIAYGNNFMVFKLDHSFSRETTYYVEITDLQSSRHRVSFRMSK